MHKCRLNGKRLTHVNLIYSYAKRSPWQIKHKVGILFKLIAETSCAAKRKGKNFNNALSGSLSRSGVTTLE